MISMNLLLVLSLFITMVSSFFTHRPHLVPKILKSAEINKENFPEGQNRINTIVQLDSPKVVTTVTLGLGESCVYCRCWKSSKFPLCDGAHAKHNKLTGDNVGPLIVSLKSNE